MSHLKTINFLFKTFTPEKNLNQQLCGPSDAPVGSFPTSKKLVIVVRGTIVSALSVDTHS